MGSRGQATPTALPPEDFHKMTLTLHLLELSSPHVEAVGMPAAAHVHFHTQGHTVLHRTLGSWTHKPSCTRVPHPEPGKGPWAALSGRLPPLFTAPHPPEFSRGGGPCLRTPCPLGAQGLHLLCGVLPFCKEALWAPLLLQVLPSLPCLEDQGSMGALLGGGGPKGGSPRPRLALELPGLVGAHRPRSRLQVVVSLRNGEVFPGEPRHPDRRCRCGGCPESHSANM